MKQEIYLNDFINAFKEMKRDDYSYEGYKKLFDYYDQFDYYDRLENFKPDVIDICLEVSEYNKEELLEDYSYLLNKEEFQKENEYTNEELDDEYLQVLVTELEQHACIIPLNNGSYLVWTF